MGAAGPLAPPDRMRLAKLCGLLGSDFDGERAAAALAADRLVRGSGLTWADVFAVTDVGPRRLTERSGAIAVCMSHRGELTDWEWRFISSLRGRSRLSPAQAAKLTEIAARF